MNPRKRTLSVAQNLRMFVICFLFVIYLHSGYCWLLATVPMPIGEVVPSYSQVKEGSNLTLNCTLMSYSATSLDSSALYFIAVYSNIPQVVDAAFYHVLTRRTLQLLIPDVKREDGTTFKCHVNDSDLTNNADTYIDSATVDIGRPPDPIVNVSAVSDNLEDMTVDWCPTVPQKDPVDSHLSWAIENSDLSGNCSVWDNSRGYHCACIFCYTSTSLLCRGQKQAFYPFQTYNITINSSNVYGSTTASLQVYTDSKIVKPSPVGELHVTPLSSHSLQASWNAPVEPSVLSLIYQINVFSEWGINSTIDAGPNTSWLITDLTPATAYTVAVCCKPPVEGYWSDDSLASAETIESVPAVAPESPIGFFRTSVCSKEDICPVTIFWKLIDASLQNGVILGYRVTIESTHCITSCEMDVIGGSTTSVDIKFPEGVSCWVRLVAYTSVGESPPHYFYFPPYFKSLPGADAQGLYAEYTDDDGTGIFFSWNYVEDVENYTLMYCAGKQMDKTHCLSSPLSVTLPRHQTNLTMSPINPDDVYALSTNYRNGTSGLTPSWICIYEYSGLPKKPELKSITQVTDTSVKVVWSPLTCTTDNRVRVLNYTLTCINNSTLDGVNVTLPGSVTEYTLTGLIPEVEYTLTLKGVSRSGPGPATTESIKTNPAKPVNIIIPIAVAVSVVVVVVVVVVIIVYLCRKYLNWFNSVTITAPEKYQNKNVVNETAGIHNNYAALSDSGSNLHAYADISIVPSSVILDCDSSCHISLQDMCLLAICVKSANKNLELQMFICWGHDGFKNRTPMIPNEYADLEAILLVPSSSQNDVHPVTINETDNSESLDSISSNKTTSTSCESEESIQTYTAVANPGMSPESPSSRTSLESPSSHCSPDGTDLPNHDVITHQLQPRIEEPTQDSSDSYGYSQAHQSNELDSSIDSSSSCDDYKSVRFKEGSFDEPIGEPITPQLV